MPTFFFQSSKQSEWFFSGMAFNTLFDTAFISSIVSKRCPRSGLLSLLMEVNKSTNNEYVYQKKENVHLKKISSTSKKLHAPFKNVCKKKSAPKNLKKCAPNQMFLSTKIIIFVHKSVHQNNNYNEKKIDVC